MARVDTSKYQTFPQITERLDDIVSQVRDKDVSLERSPEEAAQLEEQAANKDEAADEDASGDEAVEAASAQENA